MNQEETETALFYKVVVNGEEQYSIWLADRENPMGWYDEGTHGTKQDCLARISKIWTDMRPKSLREEMKILLNRSAPDDKAKRTTQRLAQRNGRPNRGKSNTSRKVT
jgi:MbtH protein